jgi:hypothetical protein
VFVVQGDCRPRGAGVDGWLRVRSVRVVAAGGGRRGGAQYAAEIAEVLVISSGDPGKNIPKRQHSKGRRLDFVIYLGLALPYTEREGNQTPGHASSYGTRGPDGPINTVENDNMNRLL